MRQGWQRFHNQGVILSAMAPDTLYRSFDGLDWYKFEDAQKWEERVNAVRRSLDEIGGYKGLCQLTQQTENREGGFLNIEVGLITAEKLAESLEEIAALGKWAQKVLDEVGDCRLHPSMEPGPFQNWD